MNTVSNVNYFFVDLNNKFKYKHLRNALRWAEKKVSNVSKGPHPSPKEIRIYRQTTFSNKSGKMFTKSERVALVNAVSDNSVTIAFKDINVRNEADAE